MADGLSELMNDPRRAPVLLLGTSWPNYRDDLLSRPSTSRLLRDCFISVPTSFDERAYSMALSSVDPRVSEAARCAEHGAVVQYLAGVPELMARTHGASTAARALLNAAVDARRAGHEEWLPQ